MAHKHFLGGAERRQLCGGSNSDGWDGGIQAAVQTANAVLLGYRKEGVEHPLVLVLVSNSDFLLSLSLEMYFDL